MAWYDEAIFYHIYPLGLTGAEKENKGEEIFHRFDELNGWVEHIEQLGCTAIYIGPLFEAATHGYDTKDYKLVDRRLGDNEDFKKFVSLCHEKNIKVVVDGVFNHTGREFFAFQDIQKNRENSPYCNWYKGINFGGNTHYNDGFSYEAWRNCFELANLNLFEPQVRNYLIDVIRFWIQEFDIDGIRLDCADCLDFQFLKEMRQAVDGEKPEFWLMGEVIHGDYSRYISSELLHSVTNYELHKGLYSGHNDQNYFEIAHTIRREFDPNGGLYRGMKLYSFVDNHDVDRIMSKLTVKENIRPVYMLLYSLPGIPSIYYGSEFGVEGRKEGSCDDGMRASISLQEMKEHNPNPELTKLIQQIGAYRNQNPVLAKGTYLELMLTNKQYAFARAAEGEAIITAVNNDSSDAQVYVPVPIQGKAIHWLTGEELPINDGKVCITLRANDGAFVKIK